MLHEGDLLPLVAENVGAVALVLSGGELAALEPIADRVIGPRRDNASRLSAGRE